MGPHPAGPVSLRKGEIWKLSHARTRGNWDDGVAEVGLEGSPRGCLLPDRWAGALPAAGVHTHSHPLQPGGFPWKRKC